MISSENRRTGRKKACILVGAGDFSETAVDRREEDLCIAVDGGFRYCTALSLCPDMIVGDMDSLDDKVYKDIAEIKSKNPDKVVWLKPEKDDTDMLAAMRIGLEKGYRLFYIYGASGGRLEHTLANIQCLNYLKEQGAEAYILDAELMLTIICEEKISFDAERKGYFSLFSLGEKAEGVTIKGMKYLLDRAVITDTYPIGVSNEFMGVPSEVSVEKGKLLLLINGQKQQVKN